MLMLDILQKQYSMSHQGTLVTAPEAPAPSAIGLLDRPANPPETTPTGGVSFEVADAIVTLRAVSGLPEETPGRAETLAVAEARVDVATLHAQRCRPRAYTPETAVAAILSPPEPRRRCDSFMTETAAWVAAPPANESGQVRLIGVQAVADVKGRAKNLVENSEAVVDRWEWAQATVIAFSPAQRVLVARALERRVAAGDPAARLALEHLLQAAAPIAEPLGSSTTPEPSAANQRIATVANWLANIRPRLRPLRLAGLAMMLVHR